LRAGDEAWPPLPLPTSGGAAATVAAWRALEPRGFKVRSRALTNTLYARLFLADLFVHGIGGGKYDEVTDAIMRRFYRLEPPGYLVLSATLLLPLPFFPVSPEDCRRLARQLRDLHYNPQRHLDMVSDPDARVTAEEMAAQKQAWVMKAVTDKRGRRERFRVLRSLTKDLETLLTGREEQLRGELGRCEERLQANAILRRRDYAFCLYPEGLLRGFCTRFVQG
jgi:hypothetical protein